MYPNNGRVQGVAPVGSAAPGNTSTTALSSGATFTGAWETNAFPDVMVSCQQDNTATLYFDFSNDGGTTYSTFPVNGFKVASGIHEFHTAVKGPRSFRVRLVNDSGSPTYLRLYTYFGTYAKEPNAPLNQTIGLDSDATSTRPNSFQDEVRIGRRPGVAGWTKFSHRDGLTASAGPQLVWRHSSNTYTPATSGDTFDIAYDGTSGGSTDGAGFTGARTLYFQYIDDNGLPATAVHTLGTDGTDTTSFSGLGINRIAVSSSGSAQQNNAAITVTHTSSGNVMGIIAATAGVTEQAIFHVGSNHDAVAKFLWFNAVKGSGGGSPTVKIAGWVWNRNVATYYRVFESLIDTSVELTQSINEPIGFNLSPADVIYFTADTSQDNVECHLRFSLNEYQRS